MKGKKSDLKIPKNYVKKKSSKGIQCFECHGYGHIASDCATKKVKKKAFNLTWDDDTSEKDDKKSESEKTEASKERLMTFMATSVSATPPISSDDGTDQDVSESDTEHDWKAKCQLLFAKSMKILKMNGKVATSWKESEEQNISLKVELSDAFTKVSHLEAKNNKLADNLTAKAQKCDLLDHDLKALNAENTDLQGRLKMVLSELDTSEASQNRMNTGSKKLNAILCSQKAKTDMHGIGYADEASTSKAKGTNYFVSNSVITNHAVYVDNTAAKKKNVSRPNRIPTCHHCGIKGHIRHYCNKLRKSPNRMQWKI